MLTLEQRKRLRKLMRHIASQMRPDPLEGRAYLKQLIEANTLDGMVSVENGGRDCDGYSYTYVNAIPAQVMAFVKFRDRCGESAEGPWHCYIGTPTPEDIAHYRWVQAELARE